MDAAPLRAGLAAGAGARGAAVRTGFAGTPPFTESARQLARVGGQPHVQRLLGVAMAGALTGVLVEFLFYLIASAAPRSVEGNAKFFASAYLVMHGSAFLLQIALYRRLQRRIGVTGMLMLLPLVLFGGASALLAGAAAIVGQGLRLAEGGVKQSLHRSSWEQAFLPVRRSEPV